MGSACRSGLAVAGLLLGAACGGGDSVADLWRPSAAASWQWQLQGAVNTGYDVDVYDIDLVMTSPDVFDRLRSDVRRVVCYFSAGTWETFRGDRAPPAEAMGNPLVDFPDERWLDIRHAGVRTRVVGQLDLARERNCDGVEPDNVDGFANDTGFDLSAADQLAFNRFLAAEAHERDLAVGLKNDLDQVGELARDFDFAVNEQCHEFAECEALVSFVDAGKPVFNAEYHDTFRRDQGRCATRATDSVCRRSYFPPSSTTRSASAATTDNNGWRGAGSRHMASRCAVVGERAVRGEQPGELAATSFSNHVVDAYTVRSPTSIRRHRPLRPSDTAPAAI